ncbi:MAG TPA: hypothetical protein VMW09_03510 [Desulfatiglandales bacterium]|nr:hypothetical protein [Desulfatiglandales bacterium]
MKKEIDQKEALKYLDRIENHLSRLCDLVPSIKVESFSPLKKLTLEELNQPKALMIDILIQISLLRGYLSAAFPTQDEQIRTIRESGEVPKPELIKSERLDDSEDKDPR